MAEMMRSSRAGVVVLSCSDPRLNPYQILGIDASLRKSFHSSRATEQYANGLKGATMVRNAGGRVFDAIRTLAVLQTIGAPGTIVVMHHTGTSVLNRLKSYLIGHRRLRLDSFP
jgi:carbonic anhydrase